MSGSSNLVASLVGLATILIRWWIDGDRARMTLAAEQLKKIEEASNAEIRKAVAAHERASSDRNYGRM